MAENKETFFTYKGLPLVRKGNELYYGNMSDEYVVRMQIEETKEENGMQVASKVRIIKMATDKDLPFDKIFVKNAEKSSLYEALDIACAWLGNY
ncbi:MAG: hypothetical protein IJ031_05400 [Oscillospiraceae bacterium]|nr:hypothetical protein [Oscillospiraceae bacterium]MBQ8884009.1 hypothetical protein [Oscillospiraceae bacterium]